MFRNKLLCRVCRAIRVVIMVVGVIGGKLGKGRKGYRLNVVYCQIKDNFIIFNLLPILTT